MILSLTYSSVKWVLLWGPLVAGSWENPQFFQGLSLFQGLEEWEQMPQEPKAAGDTASPSPLPVIGSGDPGFSQSGPGNLLATVARLGQTVPE